jgi:hypothetical protein
VELADDNHCQNLDQGHLMCAEDNLQTEKIRAEDCARAHQQAAPLVRQKWGAAVTL